MKGRSHDKVMTKIFRRDPGYAVELLNSILEDGGQGESLIALRQMADAFGGVHSVAKSVELNPSQLYRALSDKSNPEVCSLAAILRAMGLRLATQPLHPATVGHRYMPEGRIMEALINVLAVLSGIVGVATLGLGILWGVDWPLWAVVLGGAACTGTAVACVPITVLMEVPAGA